MIITVSRQYGSGGSELGRKLAEKLSLPVYDHELISKISAEYGIREHILKAMDEVHGADNPLTLIMTPEEQRIFDGDVAFRSKALFHIQADLIRKLAGEGDCVFIGRQAEYVLKDRDDVLSVLVYAEKEDRVKRIMKAEGKSHAEAERLIRDKDKERREYYSYYTNRRWMDFRNYDYAFNASGLSIDEMCGIICLEAGAGAQKGDAAEADAVKADAVKADAQKAGAQPGVYVLESDDMRLRTEAGVKLGQLLGIPVYGRDLKTLAAEGRDFTPEEAEKYDERTTLRQPLLFKQPHYVEGTEKRKPGVNVEEYIFGCITDKITELAHEKPCVILGHAASFSLRRMEHVLSVRLTAAGQEVDRDYQRYYEYFTASSWENDSETDLVINTTGLTTEEVAEKIIRAGAVLTEGSGAREA